MYDGQYLERVLIVRERLEMLQRMAGYKTLADFARAAGINDATMRQHIARESVPYAKAQQYAQTVAKRGVAVTPEWIMTGRGPAPITGASYAEMHATVGNSHNMITGSGGDVTNVTPARYQTGNILFFEAAELSGGFMNLAWGRPIQIPGRPEWSTSANDFACYVNTDLMYPALERGDRILVNTVSPPTVGDLIVLLQGEGPDGRKMAIRRLLDIGDSAWRVEQINPRKTDSFDRAVWSTVYRIQGIRKK